MGYSCTANANEALECCIYSQAPVFRTEQDRDNDKPMGNAWAYKGNEYFFERGREQSDGAITGTIYKTLHGYYGPGRDACKKVGTVRIESTGIVKRFPCIDRTMIPEHLARDLRRGGGLL